ncbi:DUF3179 domain-containing protein [Candidatus Bipolaricaulota bacterium]|nr:DUF3179 domain-containing protein [Candidatus Bipolaricaulota bacterium]
MLRTYESRSLRIGLQLTCVVAALLVSSAVWASSEDVNVSASGTLEYRSDLDVRVLHIRNGYGCLVDFPLYEAIDQADRTWDDHDLVLGLELNGSARAYPLEALGPPRFHIVNDVFGDIPVAVTFCPLCYSALVFERPLVDGIVLTFATAGLYLRNLVMFDPATLSLWQQLTGEPIAWLADGPLGIDREPLALIPADIVEYGEWKAAYPETLVYVDPTRRAAVGMRCSFPELSLYGEIAQGSVDRNIESPTIIDRRLPERELVMGIVVDGQPKAYTEVRLDDLGIVNDLVGGESIVVLVDPVSRVIRFFNRRVGSRVLTFARSDEQVSDEETGTRWSWDGVALTGPLEGESLEEIPATPSYWFAWSEFYVGTELYE